MSDRKQLTVNMAATVVAMLAGFAVSFFLTPYLVENVGAESYGFFKLANDFGSYALIFTFLVNSMTGRFVAISWHQGHTMEANKYFSSSVVSSIVLVSVLSIPLFFVVSHLEALVTIPAEIVPDVKTLFYLVLANWAVTTLFSSYTSGYYARNRLDISSAVTILTTVLYVGLLLLMFGTLQPMISYIGVAAVAVGIVTVTSNVAFQRRLLPEVRLGSKNIDLESFKALIAASSWNSLNRVSAILLEGLDLLFANIFLGPTAMAIVAVAKTVPGLVKNLSATLVRIFSPNLTALWAKNRTPELLHEISFAMRTISMVIIIPIAGFLVVGDVFYSLWLPSMDSDLLYRLSSLVLVTAGIVAPMEVLLNVFVTTNRVKLPAIVYFLSGIITAAAVVTALRITDNGVWAIIAVSSLIAVLRELAFTPQYASKVLSCSPRVFYVVMGRAILALGLTVLVGFISRTAIGLDDNWLSLIIFSAFLMAVVSGMVVLVMLEANERQLLQRKFLQMTSRWLRR